jgi:hypothetical protein
MPLLITSRSTFTGLGHSPFSALAELSYFDTPFISQELAVRILRRLVKREASIGMERRVSNLWTKDLAFRQFPRLTSSQKFYKVVNYLAMLCCLGIAFVAEFLNFLFVDQCGYLYYIVGIAQLFFDRWRRSQLFPLDGSENTWGFGQLVPLLLIALPLLSTLEIFYGMFTNYPRSLEYLT